MDAAVVVSIIAAALSFAALIVSIVAAKYAARSASASENSAVANSTTAAVEVDRRHAELTPRLRIRCRPPNPGSDRLKLTVFLVGPPELRQLDKLTVTIRDDHPWRGRTNQIAGGPSSEQIAAQIWGPFRFVPGTGPGADPSRGVPGADSLGRSTTTSGLPVGEELPFSLEPTHAPPWSAHTPQDWRTERGTVLRLTFECHKDGAEPWVLNGEIDTQTDNPVHVPFSP
jgi:hypothetical protein